VGAINKLDEVRFGEQLSPYLSRRDTFTVISSDFCHWWALFNSTLPSLTFPHRGTRFSYTHYYPKPPPSDAPAIHLSRGSVLPPELSYHPIHESISALDHEAMHILTLPPSTAHDQFASYLSKTHNTICGRHPIGVLLGALAKLEQEGSQPKIKWVRYEQSSKCFTIRDSSVSYASAYVSF
jgi:AmmeMemoRadiSam system protein B